MLSAMRRSSIGGNTILRATGPSRAFCGSSILLDKIRLGQEPLEFMLKQDQKVFTRVPGSFIFNRLLDEKFRLGHTHMYDAPLANFNAGAKRNSFGFAVLGLLMSSMMEMTDIFFEGASTLVAFFTVAPFPVVQYLSAPYVAKVFRLYDTSKPQTLENLTDEETLVIQKINFMGTKTYNELVAVKNLRLPKDYETRFGWVNWVLDDPETGTKKYFYIVDDMGGVAMDRIWGIVEKNSGVDNGRTFEK
ncbi:unnamed protein product [Kuraishia capsulata CBS 1993]|uniref:Uncharacterized protein n=1 Tax=Kuraishia capsulata CBS 1993 TaxID=1382522 RepID=W6MQ68_9ASCO|nr:uncharacterized protein KUCA_T00004461001 [Kuraishia capsulata CBS 1993]CDK28478.1 unnamed protein product [Kuraishia capsulata CBS 1993]